MSRLASDLGVPEDDVYPADYFDLMGGVGFGGYACIVSLCDVLLFVFSDSSLSYLGIFV
jgi:hypothetical protein